MYCRLALGALLLVLATSAFGGTLGFGDIPPDDAGLDRDRNRVRVSDSRGKVVAVVFWASWCGQCRRELPVLERFQQAAPDDLHVIAVNYGETARKLRGMRRAMRDYRMTITHDFDRSIGEQYGVSGIPHLVLIDRQGLIADVKIGFNAERSPERLLEVFEQLLAEAP